MKLKGFRIQNFRSIVDTGWTYLSPDNITGMIGQNESGKTSIQEALNSFYTGIISEDILRSDLSLPVVYCVFETVNVDVESELNEKLVPEGVTKKIKELNTICLKRSWSEEMTTKIELAGDEVLKIYNDFYDKRNREKEKINEKINIAITKHDEALNIAEKAITQKQKKLNELEEVREKYSLVKKNFIK